MNSFHFTTCSSTMLCALLLMACNSQPTPDPRTSRPRGRIYTAEEVQREATELIAREAEARARHRALFELKTRIEARGGKVEPLPSSPGLPNDRHRRTTGLGEEELAQSMARLRKANEDFESYVPRLDRLRTKYLERSVEIGGDGIAEQLDRIELKGTGTLKLVHLERELQLHLVYVPPGRGVLGVDLDDPDLPAPLLRRGLARVIASPLVEIIQAEGFFLQQNELTRGELAILRGVPAPTEEALELPATELNWKEALGLAAAIRDTQIAVRLPSEVEWEYAARYDTASIARFYPWGDMHSSERIGSLSKAVVSPSACGVDLSFLGARHLAGNVREWTLDTWRERRWEALAPRSVQHASRVELPAADDLPTSVAVRGTYAGDPVATHYEAAWRAGVAPRERSATIGVRFVVLRR